MMLACLCNCTFAQSVVTGIVRDTIGTALEGVIVRVNADKATLGFARTSENGTYKITLKSDAKQLIVTAEAIGYEKTKRGCCKSSSHLPTRGYFVIQLSLVYRKE